MDKVNSCTETPKLAPAELTITFGEQYAWKLIGKITVAFLPHVPNCILISLLKSNS